MGHNVEEFARWKRWDNWQNVAMRSPALWEQSMLEFAQFTVGKIAVENLSHLRLRFAIGVQA